MIHKFELELDLHQEGFVLNGASLSSWLNWRMLRRDICLKGNYREIPLAFEHTEPGSLVIILSWETRTSPVADSSTTKINTWFSSVFCVSTS